MEADDEIVARYLGAIETGRAAPSDFPNPETVAPALAGADMVAGDDQDGLQVQLAESVPGSEANVRRLEEEFVKVAADYSARRGMTYESWRQAGVHPHVLARAGIEARQESPPAGHG